MLTLADVRAREVRRRLDRRGRRQRSRATGRGSPGAPEAPAAGGRRARRAATATAGRTAAKPAPAGTTEADRWTSSSSGCRQRQERRRPAPGRSSRRGVHRPRRDDRECGRGPDPGDLRGPRVSRASAPASAMRSWRSDRQPGGGHRAGDRDGRRGGRRPTQSLAAVPRTAGGLARRRPRSARPAAPAQSEPRPLVAGPDPIGAIRTLAAARKRFYAVGAGSRARPGRDRRRRGRRGRRGVDAGPRPPPCPRRPCLRAPRRRSSSCRAD